MTQIPAGKSTGGVLQIPVAATQKNASATPKKAPKPAAPRLKLIVRRLPPGLTQAEFETALGPEWRIGGGKVDWFQYKPGKISKDPAKPSRPSRAYIHVMSSDHSIPLSNKVRQTPFLDARNTSNDPVLLGPPSLEFAPYAKIAGSRSRKDARQGTIDQDPEFIAFLESLTQPIAKPSAVESADNEDKKETVTVTPLVQYIKEKKANKAKESSKSSKHKSDKDSKAEKFQAKKLLQRPDKEANQPAATEKPEKKSKSDKATKEAVKAASKQAANVAAKQAAKSSPAQNSPKDTPQPATERKRERGSVAAAAKILQRDLGLAPSGGRRKGGRAAATDGDASKSDQSGTATPDTGKKETPSRPSKGTSTQNKKGNNTQQPSEPSEANTPPVSTTPKPTKAAKGKQASAGPTATATQAFLKHANPSQGVTEPLLETAFSPFGKILKVEIDKKKGFGYIDFADPDGLHKAIAASPVSVAQSQVVVLERKANPGGEKGRGKGRGEAQPSSGGGGGGGNNNRGGKSNEGGSSGGNSSRGPRGGRGSKSKGGPKGGGGGNSGGSAGNASSNPPESKGNSDSK
ncbi:hypothetical protein BO94DRAFT_534457 [Aspergillus sclerotioniger CBS 115572]|uniref:RRM domain-containing protein n=1 Tax=Aspergillus sclerotioniger CBS 115572 TaxID=1450535 RepID=A0A317WRD2_9EURO|nr:hypothetical protein BO94DRAFT_534457 [Aspergillus sclerotioniger CBS 115572]PWY88565.1 hypothetical protein BO94DRAFT_534457 [Aspergillus sclerotioniger CBS 115572]